MLTLRMQRYHLTPHTVGDFAGVPENVRPIWCGRTDGWLQVQELIRRIEADVARYAEAQPLRFRQAMRGACLGFPSRKSKIQNRKSKIG